VAAKLAIILARFGWLSQPGNGPRFAGASNDRSIDRVATRQRTSKTRKTKNLVVGIDVGGTKIAMMACDTDQGEEIARQNVETPADAGPESFVDQLGAAIEALVDEAGRSMAQVSALGVAVPGPVDLDDGRVIVAGNLAGWKDVPLQGMLNRRYGIPVWIDQDANAAALGERWRGAARKMHNFVFLALGTGIGAGVVINGRLHRGYHNLAGEVGSFVMGRQHLGKERRGHGSLELLIGGPAIRKEARKIVRKQLTAAEAIDLADEDRRLKPVADRVADYLAIAVINIAALLDPQAIIFGGGTASAGADLIDRVRIRVERELRVVPALMHSILGEDAQLHGAVFGALWQLDPELALREELR
jgi:glucokinase